VLGWLGAVLGDSLPLGELVGALLAGAFGLVFRAFVALAFVAG
jgi:hypothetical protein